MTPLVVALALIHLTGPTGARIDLNADGIASIREPGAMPEGHWARGVHCVVVVDGSGVVAVRESCAEVRAAVRGRTGPCVMVCGEAPPR